MRVLEVLASGAVGGGSTHLRELATGLDPVRIACQVSCSEDGPLAQDLESAGVPVTRLSMRRALNPGAIRPLAMLMRHQRIDLVHAHGTRAALCALPAARLLGLPALYTVHGWSCHARGGPGLEQLARQAERAATKLADEVICVSRHDLEAGLRWGLLQPSRSQVISNGIDPGRFAPMPLRRDAMRRQLGIPAEAPALMVCGRLTHQKGQRIFLHAAASLLGRHPEATFVLVGDGPERAALEAVAQSLGLAEHVRFTGARADMPAVLAAADVFVLPSLWEGLPIALLEALACEVPAIATAVGGAAEIVQPGLNGLLVPPGQSEPLAEAMHALLATPIWARRLARAGRERVLARYSGEVMVAEVAELYLRLAPR